MVRAMTSQSISLTADSLVCDRGGRRVFEGVSFDVTGGNALVVRGPNGSGKSTFLRLLVGKEAPDEGSAEFVGQNVVMNYFEQNQADVLPSLPFAN